tara:strand:+ start:688 stop:2091 length:1404 start_codon:yes stop_codon:yes gene_type:complete
MKTLQEQYNSIQEGKGRKDLFLKEAKKTYPNLLSNLTSYNDATSILKSKNKINEGLGGIVTLKPLVQLTSEDFNPNKQDWERKYEDFVNEEKAKSLKPIINKDIDKKINTEKEDDKIKADAKETSKTVTNTQDRNYDYSPKEDNINNVNAQEMMNGVYFELKEDPSLTLEKAQEKVIKNLAKDPLTYVKNGQFGVGVGYTETEVQENSGKTYGGSGYSDKLKKSDTKMKPIKESLFKKLIKEGLGGVVTSGNPNSLAAQSGREIRRIMAEDGFQADQAGSQYHASLYAESNDEKAGPMDEAPKPDFMDIDKDGDKEESMKKAGKDKKSKKPKKDSIDAKLAEIGLQAETVKMEAQLEFLTNHISEKQDRLSGINEDENMLELMDKTKLKEMAKDIKALEKKKSQMERIYEKSCGKSYSPSKMVDEVEDIDEMDAVSWNRQNNPTQGPAGERDPKKVGQSTSAYGLNK